MIIELMTRSLATSGTEKASFSFVAMVTANIDPVNGDSGLMRSSLSFAALRGKIRRDVAHIGRTYNGSEEASEKDWEG